MRHPDGQLRDRSHQALVPEGLFVVVGHQAELVEAVLPEDAKPVLQEEQRGTGDAVRVALDALEGEDEGVLLVVNGDGPLISYKPSGNWSSGTVPPASGRRSSWPSWRIRAASGG